MIRFPANTTLAVKAGDLNENVNAAPNADVNIIGVEPELTVADMVKIVDESRISCVFCADSK
jgi:solute carrier family 12 (sodium/potassium/chloride transporter), member 2